MNFSKFKIIKKNLKDITDVCYFYSAFLNLKPRNELFIGKIKGFLEKINGKILEYVEKFTLDVRIN